MVTSNYAEANFYRNTSLLLAQTAFEASEKPFFPFMRQSRQWKASESVKASQGKGFFNEFFIPASGNKFSV